MLYTGTTYTCLFILVTASLSGIKPGLATKPPQSAQVAPRPWDIERDHHLAQRKKLAMTVWSRSAR